jgi:hypothetical protein
MDKTDYENLIWMLTDSQTAYGVTIDDDGKTVWVNGRYASLKASFDSKGKIKVFDVFS